MPTIFRRHFSLGALLYGGLLLIAIALFCAYALFQARHVIMGPQITLLPQVYDGAEATVALHGKAENIISLTLNGRAVYTDDAGNFDEEVVLPIGYTVITLTAEDRYGRVRSINREYVRTSGDISNTQH
jgi:hypothetical protein